jgi:hypothetical protein
LSENVGDFAANSEQVGDSVQTTHHVGFWQNHTLVRKGRFGEILN